MGSVLAQLLQKVAEGREQHLLDDSSGVAVAYA
jgi:hypothetical protein